MAKTKKDHGGMNWMLVKDTTDCPYCGAKAGMQCKRPNWSIRSAQIPPHHAMRVAAYNDARASKPKQSKPKQDTRIRMTRADFVDYLRGTLIPDLRDSGREFTADDFEAAAQFIEDPTRNVVTIGK